MAFRVPLDNALKVWYAAIKGGEMMAAERISVTIDQEMYRHFEALRAETGQNKSHAVQEAIRMWVKNLNDALIAEGCRASREEDLAIAQASKRTALKALSREL